MEEEFGTDFSNDVSLSLSSSAVNTSESNVKEVGEIISHLSLVILVGLFNEDDLVKNISYNPSCGNTRSIRLRFWDETSQISRNVCARRHHYVLGPNIQSFFRIIDRVNSIYVEIYAGRS